MLAPRTFGVELVQFQLLQKRQLAFQLFGEAERRT